MAPEEEQQADAVGREVGERDDGLARLVEDPSEQLARMLDRLERLGEDRKVVGIVGDEVQAIVRVVVEE